MAFRVNFETCAEIGIRVVCWAIYIYLNDAEPFYRHIESNEVWMYNYPDQKSIISSRDLWIIVTVVPILIFLLDFWRNRDADDIKNGLWGLTLAYAINAVFTSFMKMTVGRPRPNFVHCCFPNTTTNENNPNRDFTKCTGPASRVWDCRRSFPSGHTSFSFVCMVFLALYLARKLQLFNKTKANGIGWRLALCAVPILGAAGIAISRTCDYHHHYQDVIAGGFLGTTITSLVFYLYFSKIPPHQRNYTEVPSRGTTPCS